jgi:RNA polymerase sigma factor (sigma-70 family)
LSIPWTPLVALPDPATATFQAERARLVRLAYRMLGSVGEAEDVVQDAWLRWREVDEDARAAIAVPAAYLSRMVTRLCLDVMKSARARREAYVGAWLPEPLVEETPARVDGDELTLSLMLALERLSPLERAAFLLHDVFGVGLDDVARTLERDVGAVRQLAVRARKHVQDAKPRYPVDEAEGDRIAHAFFVASQHGDVAALGRLLAHDVVLQADGGGRVIAFLNPICGLPRVSRLFAGLTRKFGPNAADFVEARRFDGLPGYVSRERGGVLQTTSFAIEDGLITAIYITRNPDKLARVEASIRT